MADIKLVKGPKRVLFIPESIKGRDWIQYNLEGHLQHRPVEFIDEFVEIIKKDGLTVEVK